MKFTPSASDYDMEDVKNAMRVEEIIGGSEFPDLLKYTRSCNFKCEYAWIREFLIESDKILKAMSKPSDPFQSSFPETAMSTAILGPMMRLLGFYGNGLIVLHEAPVNFSLMGDSYSRTIEGFDLYENEEKHSVEGKIDFLILSSESERKTEEIEITSPSGLNYLSLRKWELGIEVKKCGENNLSKHVSQLLLYMNVNINLETPKYGLLTNGNENILIKLFRDSSQKKCYSLFEAKGVGYLFYILKFFRFREHL
ncbi:MAG: hypothetical protein ACHWZW_07220 [Spirulina sp.]